MRPLLASLTLLAAVGGSAFAADDTPAVPGPQTAALGSQSSRTLSLDGDDWLLATDPHNVGRAEQWFTAPTKEAKATRVPWIIQAVFPAYHGVVWYWHDVDAPVNPHQGGRYSAGLTVSVHTLGSGRFLLNTLLIRENLGRSPAADRLLLNLLRHAARDLGKPLAELPADFPQQLRAIGYE